MLDMPPNLHPCAMYEPQGNVAVWREVSKTYGYTTKVALFVDRGEDSYYVMNQERVAYTSIKIPRMVDNLVANWPGPIGHDPRIRNCQKNWPWIRKVFSAIRTCDKRMQTDAYTREMYDICVAQEVNN